MVQFLDEVRMANEQEFTDEISDIKDGIYSCHDGVDTDFKIKMVQLNLLLLLVRELHNINNTLTDMRFDE